MSSDKHEIELHKAVSQLLDIARKLTWKCISANCTYILSEIMETGEDFHAQRILRNRQNRKKKPVSLAEIIATLQSLYDNLYDISLHIYLAGREETVIDVRYYLKSSLEPAYRQSVEADPPMLHAKIDWPPWIMDDSKKFDINWEHKPWLIKWKMFCAGLKYGRARQHLRKQ